MQIADIIERRVLSRLKIMSEARSSGTWTDIDNGRGGSIYNRHVAKPRGPSAQQRAVLNAKNFKNAEVKWNAMPAHERFEFLDFEMGGVEMEDRKIMTRLDWAKLVDHLGGPQETNVTDMIKSIMHWDYSATL